MKTLFNICIIFCLSYLMACSTGEDPIPEPPVSPILGEWVASNWYCTNTDNCSPAHQDPDAFVTFNVMSIDEQGGLIVADVTYNSPACVADPNCGLGDPTFGVDSASFINGRLYIDMHPTGWDQLGYVLTGRLSGDVMLCQLRYVGVGGEITYIMTENIIATRETDPTL